MTKMMLTSAALLALSLAACDNSRSGRMSHTPGEPMAPSAMAPTGQVNSQATGGGVPTPVQPGGAGGVGGGNAPGRAGSSR